MSSTPQPPPPPDPALTPVSPEVRQRMDDAVARLERLEGRIAAWEARIATLEATEAQPVVSTEDDRIGGIEGRLARLERKWAERRLAAARPPQIEAATLVPSAPPEDDVAPTALVYAKWSTLDVVAGEAVELSVLTDGFEADAEVMFTIGDLSTPGTPIARLVRPVGDEGGAVRAEWTPGPPPGKRDVQMLSMVVRCGDQEAHAPILTVRRA